MAIAVPDGTYWIHREMCDNEEIGTSFTNFVEAGSCEITDEDTNSIGLSNGTRKYIRVANNIGIHQITHKARLHNYVNDFRHQIISINGFYEGTAVPAIGDIIIYYLYDSLGS